MKSKKSINRIHKKYGNLITYLILFLMILYFTHFVFSDDGLLAYFRYKNEINELNSELSEIKKKIEYSEIELKRLDNEKRLEELMNTKYGILKENEIIYHFHREGEEY